MWCIPCELRILAMKKPVGWMKGVKEVLPIMLLVWCLGEGKCE
jgi:hypothetical protein